MLEVIEVIRRSEQGMTQPFICRDEEGDIYFVKGKGAGRDSQIYEWIAGNLAVALGLPLPEFEIVNVSEELFESLPEDWQKDLGLGPAFGSKERRVNELTFSGIDEVPLELQRDVFLFDLWVRNGDRQLYETAGNPNLFWDPGARELVVIDHNNAFDDKVNIGYILNYHIFREEGARIAGDFRLQEDYTPRLEAALLKWAEIMAGIPENWFYADDDMTLRVPNSHPEAIRKTSILSGSCLSTMTTPRDCVSR